MSRLATSFVLGYHGCDKAVAERAIRGEIDILHSKRDFDWLGPGAYFWESDPVRAMEWATEKVARGDYSAPAVIGAVIDLRNCLDMVNRDDMELVRVAHRAFSRVQKLSGLPMPKNRSLPGRPSSDRLLRFLDCAVFKFLHELLDAQPVDNREIEPFDTVRGMFAEGGRLYPGSGFRQKNHVQIAVRNNDCILGLFWPRGRAAISN